MDTWIGNYSFFRSIISPEKEAIYDYDSKVHYTYGELENRANLLANYLVEKLNVEKGDRIGFCCRNCIELFDAYYATAKIGAILITYNPLLMETELVEMVNNEGIKILFYEEIFKNKLFKLKKLVKIENCVVLSGASEKIESIHYEDIMNYSNNSFRQCKELNLEDIHMLIHTGGTTGTPKGAMLSHRSLLYNALSEIVTLNLSNKDSAYVMMPMFHTAGWNVFTLPLLHVGGRLIINKEFNPELALEILNKERTTILIGVSTIFRVMINTKGFKDTDLSSLRWILSGAAPTPREVMEKFWEKGVKFVTGYGMTEAGPNNLTICAESMTMEEIKKRYNSVGKPMYFSQVKIVNDEGKEVGINQCGELIWSGPLIFSGYWNNEKESEKVLKDGWVYTGDIARKDEEGFYYIVGRKKNMYITGGENIFPPEIENEIYKHPEVYEVCVIGVPDEKWGEVGKAIISLKSDKTINKDELRGFLKHRISSIKIPKYVQIVNELPKNNAGKIQREVIEKIYGNN